MSRVSYASTILTCIGAVGVIATGIVTAKSTIKASKLLEEAKKEKGEKLTVKETINIAGPAYIPSILIGASTIACIFGANILTKRSQASLVSAYALIDNSFREYRNKVKELYGDEADSEIKSCIAKNKYDEYEEEIPEGEQLFFDYNSMQYFTSTIDDVLQKTVTEDGLECYIISTPFDTLPPPMNCW